MNYYEHHIGDYSAATSHLSWDEDMAYTRLLRWYYHNERGIPQGQEYRLARSATPTQRKAIDAVLKEFFTLEDGVWRQKRCDQEIADYLAGEPEREARKANEENRLKRHRDERARLFKAITDAGMHAPWNIGMTELRAIAGGIPQDKPETPETFQVPLPATAAATPATATHTPYPYPVTNKEQEPRAGEDAKEPTAAGLACKAIMLAGIMANPSHPDLLAAIAEGTTTAEFRDAAIECKRKGKGFSYLLAMVRRRKADAAAPVKAKAEPSPSCHLPAAIERTTPEEREARRKAGEENIKKIEAMLPAMRVNA